jgi:hypothetical protein
VSPSQAERDRLDRLAGSGKGWGGGLPLPLLFDAIFAELMDEGSATTARLTDITRDKLEFKAQQIITNQAMGGERASTPDWESFTLDVLEQMASQGLTEFYGGTWIKGMTFQAGEELTVIPADKQAGRPAYCATARPKAEREALSQDSKIESVIAAAAGDLHPSGKGARPVSRRHLDEVREADRSFAGAARVPVMVDQHGRILDGRHRLEADPRWPTAAVTVEDDVQALAIAYALNSTQEKWPKELRERYERIILSAGDASERRKERIRKALLDNPTLTHSAIATRLGMTTGSSQQVTDGCAALILEGRISECGHLYEESGKKARGPKPAPKSRPATKSDDPDLRNDVRNKLESGEPVVAKEVAAKHGISPDTAENAIRAEKARQEGIQEGRAASPSVNSSLSTYPGESAPSHHHEDSGKRICKHCGEIYLP